MPPIKILLIEDNPGDIDIVHEMLPVTGPMGFQFESVSRLSEALARLERKGIDLVLLDLGLPDSQGLQTFHKLRKAVPAVPVIVLSGANDQDLAVTAVRDGAQDYLVKGQINESLLGPCDPVCPGTRATHGKIAGGAGQRQDPQRPDPHLRRVQENPR